MKKILALFLVICFLYIPVTYAADSVSDELIEDSDIMPYMDKVTQIVLYRWNRRYPSDRKFPALGSEWRLVAAEDFEGNSHPVITEEVYER